MGGDVNDTDGTLLNSSFDNNTLIFCTFGLKTLIHAPKIGLVLQNRSFSGISWSTRFCTPRRFTQPPKCYALQCFSVGQTPPKVPLGVMASAPNLIRGSLIPRDSAPQTASRSVQPFLHSSRQRVPILYNGCHFPHSKLPLRMGNLVSRLKHGPLGPPKSTSRTHHDRFSRCCRTHVSKRQTDRQTD